MNEFLNTGLGKTLVVIGIVLLAILALGQLMSLRYIGAGVAPSNTISVSGHGEVDEAPNLATFSFSLVSDKTTVAAAQADAAAKSKATIDYLAGAGVDKKDIQTSGYSVYPQYDYQSSVCPQAVPANGGGAMYCPPGRQVLKGYEARESVTVKVRDLTKAGDLLAGVGTTGATEVSGLTFTFDDPNAPQNDARSKAIQDARAKAQELAKELGVSLVRVVSFNESSGGGYPRPYALDAAMGKGGAPSAAPTIEPGTNTVTSDVTVVYEIR
ncbi:MAG: SIMPL domain-containing protein [Patescibacteria group bacterium]|nr:SIMPL domain-containing protein [Patescibacteria group bacterium]